MKKTLILLVLMNSFTLGFAQDRLERTVWRKIDSQSNAYFLPNATHELVSDALQGKIIAFTDESREQPLSKENLKSLMILENIGWVLKEKIIFDRQNKGHIYQPEVVTLVSDEGKTLATFDYAAVRVVGMESLWASPFTGTTLSLNEALDQRLFSGKIIRHSK